MSYPYTYALEKFGRAVYSLATGEGDIRARLLCVLQDDLLCIEKKHLPEELQQDWVWIKTETTKYEHKDSCFDSSDGHYDHYLRTNLQETMRRIRRSTGQKVAQRIVNILVSLEGDFHNNKT